MPIIFTTDPVGCVIQPGSGGPHDVRIYLAVMPSGERNACVSPSSSEASYTPGQLLERTAEGNTVTRVRLVKFLGDVPLSDGLRRAVWLVQPLPSAARRKMLTESHLTQHWSVTVTSDP